MWGQELSSQECNDLRDAYSYLEEEEFLKLVADVCMKNSKESPEFT
jgi:hypothetical protein